MNQTQTAKIPLNMRLSLACSVQMGNRTDEGEEKMRERGSNRGGGRELRGEESI